jgi:formyl-CoA transferase
LTQGLPLAGLKVLDVSTYIAAPAAAVVLGDYGADVIKVEEPRAGDPNRAMRTVASYPKSPVNYPWELDARNKRSIALDLKCAAGREALDRLIVRSDVLITNFPVPLKERLRLRYEDVAQLNPRLIYAALTGYGETGPDRDLGGFDSTAYFARSGLLDQLRYAEQPPHFSLPAQGDRSTALALVSAILLALYHRERTGEGNAVTTSLLANGLWSNGVYAQAALLGAFLPLRPPRGQPRSALGNIYRTQDGRWFLLALPLEEVTWPRLCSALERPDLEADPRFGDTQARRTNASALTAVLDAVFLTRPASHWARVLKANKLMFSPITRIEDVPHDEQAIAAGAIIESTNPRMPRTLATPFALASCPARPAGAAPSLGEHTQEILEEAGLASEDIVALRRAGAIPPLQD